MHRLHIRVRSVLEKSLKMLEFGIKNFTALESARKRIRCLKVVENPRKVLEFKSCTRRGSTGPNGNSVAKPNDGTSARGWKKPRFLNKIF